MTFKHARGFKPNKPRTLDHIKAQPYEARAARGSPHDPDVFLHNTPIGSRDWRGVLKALLRKHNREHATKEKTVSNKTVYERERILFQFFDELQSLTPYRHVDPRALRNRHIRAMTQIWQPRWSAGMIANGLSVLRTFSTWIGKPGLVGKAEDYLGKDSPLAHRSEVATYDHSWPAANVQPEQVIERARALCNFVAIELEFQRWFGARVKESICVKPHENVLARNDAPQASQDEWPHAELFLLLQEGTKGGRPRYIGIATDAQRDVIRRAQAMVPPHAHMGRPGYGLAANLAHFYYVMKKLGITKKALGVTAHGLRHGCANDHHEALTGNKTPVRGGKPLPAEQERVARESTARLLGHSRPDITGAYIGSARSRLPNSADACDEEAPGSKNDEAIQKERE